MKTAKMKILDKIRKAMLALLIVTGPYYAVGQQDPIYSQYIFNMQTVNPAYVGSWKTMGFTALDREQWVGITGHPSTQTFSFQTPVISQNVGVGCDILLDQLGPERRVMFNLDYSYCVMLSKNTSLRFGINGGFTNYNNNLASLQPFQSNVPDPVLLGVIENKFMPNAGMGLFLSSPKYYLSFSVPKLFQNSFKANTSTFSNMSEIREYYVIGGIVFNLSDNIKFKPTFMTKAAVGSPFQFDISTNFLLAERFWIGAIYRSGDAIGAIAQWVIDNKLRIGYAYDFTLTDLRYYHQGTHELMISYEIAFTRRRFVSPRYF